MSGKQWTFKLIPRRKPLNKLKNGQTSISADVSCLPQYVNKEGTYYFLDKITLGQILNLFKAEVDKLTDNKQDELLLGDNETAFVTEGGVKISASVFRRKCFNNISQSDIDNSITTLLKAQAAKVRQHCEQKREDILSQCAFDHQGICREAD